MYCFWFRCRGSGRCSGGDHFHLDDRYTEGDGREKTVTDRMKLPADVANGLIFTLLKNIRTDGLPTTVSMVAFTPKPRLVKLAVTPLGEEPFSVGGSERKAMHYVL